MKRCKTREEETRAPLKTKPDDTNYSLYVAIISKLKMVYYVKYYNMYLSLSLPCVSLAKYKKVEFLYHSKSAAGLSPSSEDESSWNKSLSLKYAIAAPKQLSFIFKKK